MKSKDTSWKDCSKTKDVLGGDGLPRILPIDREYRIYRFCQLDFIGDLGGEEDFKR